MFFNIGQLKNIGQLPVIQHPTVPDTVHLFGLNFKTEL